MTEAKVADPLKCARGGAGHCYHEVPREHGPSMPPGVLPDAHSTGVFICCWCGRRKVGYDF